ncbi:site-specific integrase [Lachnospiraceae bacterium MD1]|uniref:Site-specific integrase n=1 Tax=Variimorphobacter saccharofermentans TaxID=2755051 RepID=A0A839JX29_9FIRM|nr:site-specific integrase [Variimorphobacter saccharofermentans]MBB2182233.1 site-specific integrase [Variimorphobacter saccharofermentans]
MYKEFSELLRLLKENNIMNIDDVQMREMVNKMKRELILKNHPYNIFLSSDGRYHTYVIKDGKRKPIAKKSREKVEDALVQFYKENEARTQSTLKTLYPEWLDYKLVCTNSSNTVRRIDNDWKKFYVGTPIIDIPIAKLDYITVHKWAHSIVKQMNLTQKQYRNMALIMKQILIYSVDKGLITDSPYERVRLPGKIFAKSSKKQSDTQVFLTDEQPQIEQEAYKEFYKTNNPVALAIPLAFQTGLRVGELVALRYSDIDREYLHIQRMEVRVPHKKEDGWGATEYKVVEHTKTQAGTRKVYLTTKAREILSMIKNASDSNGYVDNDYIFVNEKGRIHVRALDYRLRKYCDNLNIPEKSMHKIRKTFISTLIDHNVNINYIRETVGHESEETTYKSYCFNRLSTDMTENILENILCG